MPLEGIPEEGDRTGSSPGMAPRVPRRRPSLRIVSTGVGVVIAFVLALHLGGGWYFASTLNDRAISSESRRQALVPGYTIEVLGASDGEVTLKKPGEERLRRNSTYGLRWDGGWGILGEVTEIRADGSVVRKFEFEGGQPLQEGQRVALDTRVYPNDPLADLGLSFEDVSYRGELGEYPAWFLPGDAETWFIFVHGNGLTRRDGLRVLPTIAAEGLPALVISYRNAEDAPEDSAGRLTYGQHEWRDLEAAVQYALDHGAQSVVIQGVSMGGAVTMAFLTRSPLAERVSGVILDAPVLSFKRAVEYQASDERLPLLGLGLPRTLVWSAEWIASLRYGVDWDFTDYLDDADRLSEPILLIHGTLDSDVPIATSEELARLRPDLVRDFYRAVGAEHTAAWNLDPEEYERRVRAFLDEVVAR